MRAPVARFVQFMIALAVVLIGVLVALGLGAVLSGCYAAHEPAPETLECGPTPYGPGPRYLWHADVPWPRGRVWACETAARGEEEAIARAVALGCPIFTASDLDWTISGACDYAVAVERWEELRTAETCEELLRDPCQRPDPRYYWRPEGD